MGLEESSGRNSIFQCFNSSNGKTVGHRVRDLISTTSQNLNPVIKYIFPNFIAAHVYYIITLTLLCSLLLYPVRNHDYIDILFLATGATTQGGLNTVDLNDLKLYQQIVLYFTCIISTPIWIHGSLVFVRLFWFERYFDGIREWSKKYHQLRRTRTLIERDISQTISPKITENNSAMSSINEQGLYEHTDKSMNLKGFRTKPSKDQTVNNECEECEKDGKKYPIEKVRDGFMQSSSCKIDHSSKKTSRTIEKTFDGDGHQNFEKCLKERFTGRRSSRDINPADMFCSIAMLQDQHHEDEEEDCQTLAIKGPEERMYRSSNESSGSNGTVNSIKNQAGSFLTDLDRKCSSDLSTNLTLNGKESKKDNKKLALQETDIDSNLFSLNSGIENPNSHVLKSPGTTNSAYNVGTSIQFDIENLPRPSAKRKHYRKSDLSTGDSFIMERTPQSFRKLYTSSSPRDKLFRDSVISSTTHEDKTIDEEDYNHCESGIDIVSVRSSERSKLPETNGKPNTNNDNSSELGFSVHKDQTLLKSSIENFSKEKYGNRKFRKPDTISNFSFKSRRPSGQIRKKKNASSATISLSHYDTVNSIDSFSSFYDEENGFMGLDMNSQSTASCAKQNIYLSQDHNIGRNSNFIGLTDSQKTELGGVEYRATKLLCKTLVIYYFGLHLSIFLLFLPWIFLHNNYGEIVNQNGISKLWWSLFTSMSSFCNLGLTLTPDSMISFNKATYPLIVMIFYIIVGNTGFPIFLRILIWIMYKLVPDLSLTKENLGFLLDHPRRCFTLLFPKAATWWLFFVLVVLNIFDLVLFIVFDLNSSLKNSLSSGHKILDGLFQGVSTRTAGFSVVDISQLHPSIQVSYMLMMYVSVMPVAISIRRTNVYEEQSLGIYGDMIPILPNGADSAEDSSSESLKDQIDPNIEQNTKSFIGAHMRKQLSFDIWFMFLGLFIICIAEGYKIQDLSMPSFTVFQVLFEVVSAYGTVGLSLGYPSTSQSFSAQLTPLSKFVIIVILIRGRNRGLPYTLDRAIMLPSDKLRRFDKIEDLKLQRAITMNTKDPLLNYLKIRTRPVSSSIANVLRRTKSHISQATTQPRDFGDSNSIKAQSIHNIKNPLQPDKSKSNVNIDYEIVSPQICDVDGESKDSKKDLKSPSHSPKSPLSA